VPVDRNAAGSCSIGAKGGYCYHYPEAKSASRGPRPRQRLFVPSDAGRLDTTSPDAPSRIGVTSFETPFARFLVLFGTLYAAFGVQSPYLPSLLQSRNLLPQSIALVLAAGTAVRLLAGPAAGALADRLDAPKAVFCVCAAAAALIALAYLPAQSLWLLFLVGVVHSAALAPLAPLSDTLALGTAAPARSINPDARGFHYGWVRGAGSAAFIVGSVLSGEAIGQFGIAVVVWLNAALLSAAAFAGRAAPVLLPKQHPAPPTIAKADLGGISALLRLPLYRRIVLVAALILGSHAMHDSFAVIRWEAAGISPATAGLLWSLSVAGEVIVFLIIGRPLLDRLGPANAAMLTALAGIVRWLTMAETTWVAALAAVEPLHGLTFALLHLNCMRLLAECVPKRLSATALTLYGTVGIGVPTALLTLASGQLYGRFGAHAFLVMAGFCAAALPITRMLRDPTAKFK
jgi:MFS transporter, PPP family, 3-phenylpropionic acid transporter